MSRRRARSVLLHRVADICQAMPGKIRATHGQVQRIALKLADKGTLTEAEWEVWARSKNLARSRPTKAVRVRMPAKRKDENRFLEMKRQVAWHGGTSE